MKKANRLITQQSPYLLQHAYNPVDWYPWCSEAFLRAEKENKPIFLSIGYSTCHWCHVMEKESFEDPEIAAYLNENFICIKVDREERPDIDGIYMLGCQLLTGGGGWPLTAITNYDKKPFFIGTYFPKKSSFGRPGLLTILQNIVAHWQTKKEELLTSSEDIFKSLNKSFSVSHNVLDNSIVKEAFSSLKKNYDREFGGFGMAPKFPSPHNLTFLMRYHNFSKDQTALDMAFDTLRAMRSGGIYDHIGYGFHRYSTDREWLVPHFEKMLYDQALTATAFIEAYLASKDDFFKDTAVQIFEYVFIEMTSPEGGFFSAEDADSENVEGKFYLWKKSEFYNILTKEEADFYCKVYNIEGEGNYDPEGNSELYNIPHLTESYRQLAKESNLSLYDFETYVNRLNNKLFLERRKRTHPYKDDKILTDWNAIMISVLTKAYIAFNVPKYIDAAETAINFIFNNLFTADGSLLHMYRSGTSQINGFIDDYAFLIKALLDLFDATHKPVYINKAIELQEYFHSHFWDKDSGGFFKTSDLTSEFPIRQKEVFDGAIPSGNSTSLQNLLRLYHYTTEPQYFEQAEILTRVFATFINSYPVGYTHFILGMLFMQHNAFDIIVAFDKYDANEKLLVYEIRERYIPFKVLIVLTPDNRDELTKTLPYLSNYTSIGHNPGIYICKDFKCSLPVTSIEEFDIIIKSMVP